MPDIILVVETQKRESGRLGKRTGHYEIRAVRLRDNEALQQMLRGVRPKKLPPESILLNEDLQFPPPEPHEPRPLGRVVIDNYQEAIRKAKEALKKPNSWARRQGFSPDTPIYFWMPNQPAEKIG